MASEYKTGTVTGHENLLEEFRRWITGYGTAAAAVAGANTGNGTVSSIDTTVDTVSETWTLTCTAGGPTGTFSVTGSVSGAQAAATVGTPYSNDYISFLINDGAVDFIIGDSFTIAATIGDMAGAGYAWEQLKLDTSTTDETHLYLKGLGNGGTDEIFVNLRTYKNAGTGYYNLELRGATGFLDASARTAQPGVSDLVDLCLWSGSIKYWFIANGRRFIIIAKVSTVYESAYAGFILPAGLPTEYPYPLAIGGCTAYTAKLYSASSGNDGYNHSAFFNPGRQSAGLGALYVLDKSGAWRNFYNYSIGSAVWGGSYNRVNPWGGGRSLNTTEGSPIYPNLNSGAIDASSGYSLFPATILSRVASPATKDIFGDFEGVYHVSGYGNASENIVQVGGDDYLVIQNTYRTGNAEYAAFKLA